MVHLFWYGLRRSIGVTRTLSSRRTIAPLARGVAIDPMLETAGGAAVCGVGAPAGFAAGAPGVAIAAAAAARGGSGAPATAGAPIATGVPMTSPTASPAWTTSTPRRMTTFFDATSFVT